MVRNGQNLDESPTTLWGQMQEQRRNLIQGFQVHSNRGHVLISLADALRDAGLLSNLDGSIQTTYQTSSGPSSEDHPQSVAWDLLE